MGQGRSQGDTVRFAIGHPDGPSSNSWRCWTTPPGDVYLACRDNYQDVKVSLHVSGRWRMGVTSESRFAALAQPGVNRAWEVWDSPPLGSVPAAQAFRVFFLPTELALTPALRPPREWREVTFAPPPGDGRVVVATLSITDGTPDINFAGLPTLTVAQLPLPEGRFVQVTAHEEPLGRGFAEKVVRSLTMVREHARSAALPVVPVDGRLLFFGPSDTDEVRFIVEVNWHRPEGEDPIVASLLPDAPA